MIRIEFDGNKTLNATESVYEQNIRKTYSLRAKPNSDNNIIFWYYTGSYSSGVLHQKIIPYRTTLDEATALEYAIDCSTF
jgi:hypothetical protein